MVGRSRLAGRGAPRTASREFAVIGLDRFGASLARRLEAMGHMVLGVDTHLERVQELSGDISSAVALDATSEDALLEVDIASFATVVVAMEDDFESTALIAAHLKALGIPRVVCMGESRRHREILLRIGADQVIVSDEDSGERLAEVLAAPAMLERVALDADHSLIEFKVSASLVGQSVSALSRYDVTAVLIQRPDCLIPCPGAEIRLEAGDTIFAVGLRERVLEVATLP